MRIGYHGTKDLAVATAAVQMLLGGCAGPMPAQDDEPDPVGITTSALISHQRDDGDDDDHDGCRRAPADVPPTLAVPTDECLTVQAMGSGDQIYTCASGGWALKAPEANLLDRKGRFVGNHFLGPTWQWRDGSKIKGAKVAQASAPDGTHDIPWLLLSVTGEYGKGSLAGVKHIQRLHTSGGVMPTEPCTATSPDVRGHYTADYLFYSLREEGAP